MIPLLQKHAMITRGIVSPDGGVLVRRKKIKAFPDDFENWKIPCPLIEFARFVQDNAELDFRIDRLHSLLESKIIHSVLFRSDPLFRLDIEVAVVALVSVFKIPDFVGRGMSELRAAFRPRMRIIGR